MRAPRLTPHIWLLAGLDALQSDGPQALAAEPMARRIGTTKGSFYWHFKDVPAYHTALLAHWQADALAAVMALVEGTGPADQSLRNFGTVLLADRTEASLRVWAQGNPLVAATLQEVDAQRLVYLTRLLRQLDLGNPDFARALLATLVGLPQISDDKATRQQTFDTLVDTVLALR